MYSQALQVIQRDYIGIPGDPSTPLFGQEFKWMFRLSRPRFELLVQDVLNRQIPFYQPKKNLPADAQASIYAKLLLPLKCLAYGVPPHCFTDYFQMSKAYASVCCHEFDKVVKLLYTSEWLRLPTPTDLRNIMKLHKAVHGFPGMIGSLDCSHTYWKNCPKAWQGSYMGKEKMPSLVLEAISDYHLFFWHASYGYTGSLNDKTILSLSPLLDRLIDGEFEKVERESGAIPFLINGQPFHESWITVDGIYPKYSRFVRGIKEPYTENQKRYTKWQEATRKDIERAFGVLKGTWQFLDRPILLMDLNHISLRVTTCMILHNMLVSDRVMQQVGVLYDPSNVLEEMEDAVDRVQQPDDLNAVQAGSGNSDDAPATVTGIGIRNAPRQVQDVVTRRGRFKNLTNELEHQRLHTALAARFV